MSNTHITKEQAIRSDNKPVDATKNRFKGQKQSSKPSLELYRPPNARTGHINGMDEDIPSNQTTSVPLEELVQRSNLLPAIYSPTLTQSNYNKKLDEALKLIEKLELNSWQWQCSPRDFITTNINHDDFAEKFARALVVHAVEEKSADRRDVSKLCATLLEFSAPSSSFDTTIIYALNEYCNDREKLRILCPQLWIGYLSFVSEFLAFLDVDSEFSEKISSLLFTIYKFLLTMPCVQSLRVEEFEWLMSSLLNNGLKLELYHPDKLGITKELVRDAFLESSEFWARKMLLLLVELGGAHWEIRPDFSDFYLK